MLVAKYLRASIIAAKTPARTKSSPVDSPRTLVLALKVHPEIQKGSPGARALNEGGVGKICNFQPVSRRISETVQDSSKVTKLLLITNRKSHAPFRLVPK